MAMRSIDIDKLRFAIKFSDNKKTGPIPVSISPETTCPSSCPLINKGCYAKIGHLRIHWNHISNGSRGTTWEDHLKFIKNLPKYQLWRMNQAGDLPGYYPHDDNINEEMLNDLIIANQKKNGFTYTHKIHGRKNLRLIRKANKQGFVVNASCESYAKAKRLMGRGIPSVCIINRDNKNIGKNLKICPAQLNERVTCSQCAWCQNPNRHWVVGFLPHGINKNHVASICN